MRLSGNIQAVTFDVGGTLIRPWPSVGHVYAEEAAKHGHPALQPDCLNRQFEAAWRCKKAFDHSRCAWFELVQATFAGALDETALQKVFPHLFERFADPEVWEVFEDVHPTLEKLRRSHFKLGIISNWDERLRPLLERLQLGSYFETILISVESGSAKPAREIFEQARSFFGVPAASILHIGDSFSEDVAGAQSAGLKALFLDRQGIGGVLPSIRNLRELLDMLIISDV